MPEKDSKSYFVDQLSAEEKKIHFCLESSQNDIEKNQCLQGTIYANVFSRSPSSFITIPDNPVFKDFERLRRFYQLTRGYLKAQAVLIKRNMKSALKQGLNDRGVGFYGAAYFGFGASWAGEIVNHHERLGLFCIPGALATTDAGVEVGVSLVQSISCKSNAAYAGGFLTFSAGVSGEVIGAPFGVGAGYSFGVNVPVFRGLVQKARSNGNLSAGKIAEEFSRFNSNRDVVSLRRQNSSLNVIFDYVQRLTGLLGVSNIPNTSLQSSSSIFKKAILHHHSVGQQFKEYVANPKTQAFLKQQNLPQVKMLFDIFALSLTGCDSVSASLSAGVSVSPVSVTTQFENYKLIMDMPVQRLKSLAALTPLTVLQPWLLNQQTLNDIALMSVEVLAVPSKVRAQCGFGGYKNLFNEYGERTGPEDDSSEEIPVSDVPVDDIEGVKF